MSFDCQFQINTNLLFQCKQCGWVYPIKTEKPPRRNCPKARLLLGDYIARFTRWIGIKRPCGGCKKRQRWLNKKHAAAIGLVNGLHAAVRRRLKRP